MKRSEIAYRAESNEIEKLTARLAKAETTLEKKIKNAEKYDVLNMTKEEHMAWMKTVETNEMGFMLNKDEIKRNGAWFDLIMARDNVSEIKAKLERAEQRLVKKFETFEKEQEQELNLISAKEKEEIAKRRFEEEQEEWAKDGITLISRYSGLTPSGKKFTIYGNCGWTVRSRHCFTLMIDGNCIFTSGYFWRAYIEIKNR